MSYTLSVTSQYAIRTLFELARHRRQGPVNVRELAQAQSIPHRFLEVILGRLRNGGFVKSHRGQEGGYEAAFHPDRLTVGEVIRYFEGSLAPVGFASLQSGEERPLPQNRALNRMWNDARKAIEAIYDEKTFGDLIAEGARLRGTRRRPASATRGIRIR